MFFVGLQDDSNIYLLDWDGAEGKEGCPLRVVMKSDPSAGNLVDLLIINDDVKNVRIIVAVHTTCVVLYHLSVLDYE
jgi:hypothetical protein